jgi:nitrite reductase/ring-hydroxylating ferredoxin subunit
LNEPGRPPPGTPLCRLDEIADPGARGFDYREGDQLWSGFVVRKGETVRGYLDQCPHAGSPLGDMIGRYLTRAGDLIICSAHGALFKIEDGACIAGPCAGEALTAWPVTVEDGVVKAA